MWIYPWLFSDWFWLSFGIKSLFNKLFWGRSSNYFIIADEGLKMPPKNTFKLEFRQRKKWTPLFVILQMLQYNQAPTLGSKCQIIVTSVCCLSVSLDQEAADSNRAAHRWPVTHSDTINLHSPESLKDIEIQLCYTKSYCQDLNLSQRTSGNQLSYSVQV